MRVFREQEKTLLPRSGKTHPAEGRPDNRLFVRARPSSRFFHKMLNSFHYFNHKFGLDRLFLKHDVPFLVLPWRLFIWHIGRVTYNVTLGGFSGRIMLWLILLIFWIPQVWLRLKLCSVLCFRSCCFAQSCSERVCLGQCFPTGEEFLPREEFHEFRGGISTSYLSYLFIVSVPQGRSEKVQNEQMEECIKEVWNHWLRVFDNTCLGGGGRRDDRSVLSPPPSLTVYV